jgi:tRNA threonylcarbamoyladenosine biosynthesis protein TsaB
MRVLALDSTTRAGSVAVVDDDRVLIERAGDPGITHAERLPRDILELGIPLESVDLFAVACGPGSFTGLRVGIATIQGLAFTLRKRVAPVSALEALAQIGSRTLPSGSTIGVWMDAHRHEVFSALYRIAEGAMFSSSRLAEVEAPEVGDAARTLARWVAAGRAPDAIIGDGAEVFPAPGERLRILPAPPLAAAIAAIGAFRAHEGRTVDPAGVQPLYIRRPDAEVARERMMRK